MRRVLCFDLLAVTLIKPSLFIFDFFFFRSSDLQLITSRFGHEVSSNTVV